MTTQVRKVLEEILNEYRVRCVHGRKMGIDSEEAANQIHSLYKKHYLSCVPEDIQDKDMPEHERKELFDLYKAGWNACAAKTRANMEKLGGK